MAAGTSAPRLPYLQSSSPGICGVAGELSPSEDGARGKGDVSCLKSSSTTSFKRGWGKSKGFAAREAARTEPRRGQEVEAASPGEPHPWDMCMGCAGLGR